MVGINAGTFAVYFSREENKTEEVKTRKDSLGVWNTEFLDLRLADCVILK